jgi:hypothetical protein
MAFWEKDWITELNQQVIDARTLTLRIKEVLIKKSQAASDSSDHEMIYHMQCQTDLAVYMMGLVADMLDMQVKKVAPLVKEEPK